MKPSTSQVRRKGFTLIEIMVVLVIVAIVTSITLGVFKSLNEGTKRNQCQSNLAQIYQSCRQYAQDFDGKFPYLNGGAVTNAVTDHSATPEGGLGLWSLYTFPNPTTTGNCSTTNVDLPRTDTDTPDRLTGYVRSNRIFHCPADNYTRAAGYKAGSCTTQNVSSGNFTFKVGALTYLNPAYLSYQIADDTGAKDDTYLSVRRPDVPATSTTLAKPTRQLLPFVINSTTTPKTETPDRPTRDLTVVTWCRFHRSIDNDGATREGRRNYDNVLFSDGSVQNLPMDQSVSEASPKTGTGTCSGWNRVPRGKAENMEDAANCVPSP